MEIRETFTVDAPDQKTKLLRYPIDLHEWFEAEAKQQRRSTNSEMVLALEAWRLSKENSVSNAKKLFEFTERQETIKSLRGLCKDFGDNDWPDDLHLADVIEKHLGKYLVTILDEDKSELSKFTGITKND